MKQIVLKEISYHLVLFSLVLSMTCLSACSESDLLNVLPETAITDQNAFQTPERILGLVNGVYKSVKSASFYGGRYLLYLDVRGEEFINVTGNTYTAYESWQNAYSSGSNDVNNLWAAAYTAINNANILIEGLEASSGVIDDDLKSAYIAEAKFLRALSYFSLVSIFARPYMENEGQSPGLPLRLRAETQTDNNNLARSSVDEVYTQIIKDLDEAEASLPTNYATSLLNTTRAHKNTAIALKTRVYLTIGNYAKVVEESAKLVPQQDAPFRATEGVTHALQSNVVTVFSADYTTTESILSMPMTTVDAYSGQSSIGYIYNVNSEYYLNPAGVISLEQFGQDDARRNFLRTANGNSYLTKYAKPAPYLDYIPVLRYAEVLLNYAEATAKQGNLDLSYKLLQAVHQRADPTYVFLTGTAASATALLEAIRLERRIELLGEGFRSNDLLRNLQTIPAKGSSSLQAPAVTPSAANYIFPIPNNELNVNQDI